ncbi:hypothetical protein DAPPUDRAFT_304955 [Daphnia pulex]|uniref:Uncharacterized protein n=1 Tax=Daphnia pulex TaxID=6669 RepID=E9GMT8_DAPPU|nr:hypothetical protein DAPPUDRAFT_304955 [Daphnia pulex]|eukprot:EFX79149.1 hypothetical protein DAPPUDRAFT_304955 [Daphnia pulex]
MGGSRQAGQSQFLVATKKEGTKEEEEEGCELDAWLPDESIAQAYGFLESELRQQQQQQPTKIGGEEFSFFVLLVPSFIRARPRNIPAEWKKASGTVPFLPGSKQQPQSEAKEDNGMENPVSRRECG